MNRVMRVGQALVWTDVQSGRDLSRGSLGREHFARPLKRTGNLNAEIHIHGRLHVFRMVIEEDIVAVGAESGVLLQERPNLVESGAPGTGNLVDTNRPMDRREYSRGNNLDGNAGGHDALSLLPLKPTAGPSGPRRGLCSG